MKKLKSYEIRQMWLDFFASKGHSVEPSASLVPVNDPTLLWTNAGVAPLKKYFDGSVTPDNPRITNAQKCIRTNDIENVGKTARHHTFFEMLGNFSIGDYFKEEAIEFACELLMSEKWFGFDKDKLYMTYYPTDTVARDKWISMGVDPSHLIPLEGNFWEIGEGPCGPDSEIFYDRGEKYDNRGIRVLKEDLENDRYIEIWNIVFSQYNSKEGVARENYKELPHKNIDTGCGLERLCCVMQEVETNYDTDLFMPIINKISEISGVKYEGQMAFKVIADHVRTVTFAVADGATLSNEGRGYVLRRVLRRATKYGKKLGINKPFMAKLVDVVVEIMGMFYPYLKEKTTIIKEIITREEEKFLATISLGEKKFEAIAEQSKDNVISGADAFLLYDTFGFPYELTLEYAMEKGMTVNHDEFVSEMNEQKNRARNARKEINSMKGQNEEFMNFKEESEFIGYDTLESTSKVIKCFGDAVVLDKTPFYAFSGGQLCDKGTINDIEVLDVSKMPNGQYLHMLKDNTLSEGDIVSCRVDKEYRDLTRCNHSSAHLLQAALQQVLGNHVHQQGSQVCADYCRFDFNNYQNLTDKEILEVENLVNKYINESHPVNTKVMALDEAKKLGAMALFDDKYKDMVRVVDMEVSKEFCAGTHVSNTSDIKNFYISSIESIGSGIFRCTAYTGSKAMELLDSSISNINNTISTLLDKATYIVKEALNEGIKLEYNAPVNDNNQVGYAYILKKKEYLELVSRSLHELEKKYQALKSQSALNNVSKYKEQIENNAIVCVSDVMDSNLLKDMATALLNDNKLDLVMLAATDNQKVTFVCATSEKYDAGMMVKEAAKLTGGNGGGKKNLAQAGGKDASKIIEALDHVKGLL
ncbi:MAG: alanine--tRNA ligase [Anaeroplasmataceae bacterium]